MRFAALAKVLEKVTVAAIACLGGAAVEDELGVRCPCS
jgi:hypothetical protein